MKSTSLEDIIVKYIPYCEGKVEDTDIENLAQAIRTWFKDMIAQCLTYNDSDTHLLAKDLLEEIEK
jgi:protein tyrosine phosphatase (PTP) superfamily phosphohydrolase (DUF442 family)